MAQQVTKFQSNAGGLFDSMYDAAKHDLHVYLGKSIDNEAITKKLIDHISGDMPGFYHIVKDMEDARLDTLGGEI